MEQPPASGPSTGIVLSHKLEDQRWLENERSPNRLYRKFGKLKLCKLHNSLIADHFVVAAKDQKLNRDVIQSVSEMIDELQMY